MNGCLHSDLSGVHLTSYPIWKLGLAPPAYDLKLANQEGKELEGKKHAEIDAERPSASEVNVSTDDSQDPQITLA